MTCRDDESPAHLSELPDSSWSTQWSDGWAHPALDEVGMGLEDTFVLKRVEIEFSEVSRATFEILDDLGRVWTVEFGELVNFEVEDRVLPAGGSEDNVLSQGTNPASIMFQGIIYNPEHSLSDQAVKYSVSTLASTITFVGRLRTANLRG